MTTVAARRPPSAVATAAACALGLVLLGSACSTRPPHSPPPPAPVILTAPPPETGDCGPDRLARCVPGPADFDEELFDDVIAVTPIMSFGRWPASTIAPDGLSESCQRIPRLSTGTGADFDVTYGAATDAHGTPRSHRFAAKDAAWIDVRLTAAHAGDDLLGAVTDWARQCPAWAVAPTGADGGIQTWLLGESADALARYQSGDIAGQLPRVTQMAAKVLPSGVIAQVWYRTDDPSAASRRDTLTQLIDAMGRHRPRSALPPQLANWSPAQLTTLLPPFAKAVTIDSGAGQDAGPPWTGCQHADVVLEPRRDAVAEWSDRSDQSFGEPTVTIGRVHPGTDYLGDLRREIASCAAQSSEIPALCAGRDDRRYLTSDTALIDGEDTVRFTHRWMRVESVQAYDRCVEGIEIFRVTAVRGFLVVTTTHSGGPKAAPGPSPNLPTATLDELQSLTVHQIKTA
jgi:hypothetical protein